MYNMTIKDVPVMTWLNKKGEEIVNNFNEHEGNLVLSLFNEPDTTEDLEVMLQEGMYDFIYPENNPISPELKEVIEDSGNHARYFYFELSDVVF